MCFLKFIIIQRFFIIFKEERNLEIRGNQKIRRMPERNEVLRHDQQQIVQKAYINGINRQNNNNGPSKGSSKEVLQEKSLNTKKATNTNNQNTKATKTLGEQDIDLSDMDLDKSMSKSIEQILFNGHLLKKDTCDDNLVNHRLAERDSFDLSTTQTPSDTSILHLDADSVTGRRKESLSGTSVTDHTSDSSSSSILASSKVNRFNGTANDIKPITNMEFLNLQSPLQGISLKDFESRRKMVEEQNRQRKEMLYKAIEYQ